MIYLLVFVLFFGFGNIYAQGQTIEENERRTVGYYTSWSAYARNVTVDDIDGNLLTHLNFAFANLDNNGNILVGDSWVDVEKPFANQGWEDTDGVKGHFAQLQKLKIKYPHLKTLISVGGWTWSGNFSEVAANEQKRKQFAKSAVDFLRTYGFDGIDIDWEFPVEGNNIPHKAEDKQNYTKLLAETRNALDLAEKEDNKQYLLTIAGGPNPSFVQNTELKKMTEYLDFINIMAYDYHGAWESATGHNAPLYAEDGLSVSATVEAYLNAGVPSQQLNLGVPFYGRGWQNVTQNSLKTQGTVPASVGYGGGTWEQGVFDYWDLVENYNGKNNYKRYFDVKAGVPYLYNGTTWISFDDEESISKKLSFAESKNLGGVMFWEFSGDKNKQLQQMIANRYHRSTSEINQPTVQVVPEKEVPAVLPWDKTKVYTNGDCVIYNNKSYRAKWWTQGELPGTDQWGAWEEI